MKNEVFSEYFARKNNPLTKVDARIKIVFALTGIVATLLSSSFYMPLAIIFFVLMSLVSVKIPFKIMILRLSAPMGIAVSLFFIKILFCREDLSIASLILVKVIGATSLVLFLSMTTPLDRLLEALKWFKVPGTWVEICLIAYRYIFVLIEDAITVFDAQKARLGYVKFTGSLVSLGSLAGAIIIRAYDQSVATYEAMLIRGYKDGSENVRDA